MGFSDRNAETGIEAREKKPGIFTKRETYHLAGGQIDSLALSNMRARMNGVDIVLGSDIYSRLRANLAGAIR
jgi:hypothetical protein